MRSWSGPTTGAEGCGGRFQPRFVDIQVHQVKTQLSMMLLDLQHRQRTHAKS